MNTCEFGTNLDNGSAQCAGCAALQALNLQQGASDEEIKAAYRMLVKVWHPDLFEGDKHAKTSAEEKIRTVIAAFRVLSSQVCNDSRSGTSPECVTVDYFTIGSTRKDVQAVQGIPTAYSPDTFEYGASKVFFVADKVVGWENAPLWVHLNVQLRPAHSVDGTMHYFAKGSTKDEVLAIQGTPTGFSFNTFEYGTSRVHFKDGRVTSWENVSAWIPLKVRPA
jgi:outer membrane protein assembly factor BamE (lipoprotein component of BamABCDE complex)